MSFFLLPNRQTVPCDAKPPLRSSGKWRWLPESPVVLNIIICTIYNSVVTVIGRRITPNTSSVPSLLCFSTAPMILFHPSHGQLRHVLPISPGEDFQRHMRPARLNHERYCALHGYTYACLEENIAKRDDPTWSKIPHVLILSLGSCVNRIFAQGFPLPEADLTWNYMNEMA